MAKSKTPLFSLGAKGTIGDTITFQKRGKQTLARKKPVPTNPQSLAQMYHRWLYEDYAYLWTQQSEATKQSYRSEGAKRHLTGFSHWMSEKLTYLPDIVGMWHLDEKAGAVAFDYSRNKNHGTIFGASPATGLINGCFFFDNLNDRVSIPDHPSLNPTTSFSLEAFTLPPALDGGGILSKDDSFTTKKSFNLFTHVSGVIFFDVGNGTANFRISAPYDAGSFFHLVAVCDAAFLYLYLNGTIAVPPVPFTGPIASSPNPLTIGAWPNLLAAYFFGGYIDHAIFYNRALDATEVKRHSLRRYPLQ